MSGECDICNSTEHVEGYHERQSKGEAMMAVLVGLSGTNGAEKECRFFYSASGALTILREGYAATTADDHGALNVWIDDDGKYRCQSCRHLVTLEEKIFTSQKDVAAWVKKWLKKIQ